ncbi:hypothetical protein RCL1_004857 [Eukaryota sp. TZLM3-RCL]
MYNGLAVGSLVSSQSHVSGVHSLNLPALNLSSIRSGTFGSNVRQQNTTRPSYTSRPLRKPSSRVPVTSRVPTHINENNFKPNPPPPSSSRPSLTRPISSRTHTSRSNKPSPSTQSVRHSPVRDADFPLSPADALKRFKHYLSPFEETEILEYPQVFFLGEIYSRVKNSQGAANNGFDDDKGDYLSSLHDHIAYRYEILGSLGKGSFGQVLRCLDKKTDKIIALKIIRNKRRFHQQGLVEVKILKFLRDSDPSEQHNVVKIIDHFYFRNHLCITFELLSLNLYEYMKSTSFQPMALSQIRTFAIQILHCLKLLYRHNIIHCDLKPENVLLRHSSRHTIKVIDLGSSCFANERIYTYIQSRFYRAPEVILGIPYSTMIDMWSFGTMLCEFSSSQPIFPGENEVEQMLCIMEIFGPPPLQMIQNATRRKLFFDSNLAPRIVANSRGRKRRPNTRDLSTACRSNNPLFLDFIRQCLQWEPENRLNPLQALQHPFITGNSNIPPNISPKINNDEELVENNVSLPPI